MIDALNAADRRGVTIRIVLDPRERHDFVALGDLADNVRLKRGGPFMHLKASAIDGVLLRTGSANYDLIVIRDASAAAKFVAHFESMWDSVQPMIEFGPAVRALEVGPDDAYPRLRRRTLSPTLLPPFLINPERAANLCTRALLRDS